MSAGLPEHPREQDAVIRPLPSLFHFRLFPIFQPLPPLRPQNQLSVASSQLPENLRVRLVVCAWDDRAKSERGKANSDESKSLF